MYIILRTSENKTIFEYDKVKIVNLDKNYFSIYHEDEKEMLYENRLISFHKGENMLLMIFKNKKDMIERPGEN